MVRRALTQSSVPVLLTNGHGGLVAPRTAVSARIYFEVGRVARKGEMRAAFDVLRAAAQAGWPRSDSTTD